MDVDQFVPKQMPTGEFGRGRGDNRRGKRGPAPMNLSFPRQSANSRLKRFSEPDQENTDLRHLLNQRREANNNIKSSIDGAKNQEGLERRPDAGVDGCICLRDLMRIFCEACGTVDEGRLRKTCPIHPRDLYLYDVTNCSKCRRPYVPRDLYLYDVTNSSKCRRPYDPRDLYLYDVTNCSKC